MNVGSGGGLGGSSLGGGGIGVSGNGGGGIELSEKNFESGLHQNFSLTFIFLSFIAINKTNF